MRRLNIASLALSLAALVAGIVIGHAYPQPEPQIATGPDQIECLPQQPGQHATLEWNDRSRFTCRIYENAPPRPGVEARHGGGAMSDRITTRYGAFAMTSLPGQPQVSVCHDFFIREDERGQGLSRQLKLRQCAELRLKNYDFGICTVAESNTRQKRTLERTGWIRLAAFRNRRQSEITEVWGYDVSGEPVEPAPMFSVADDQLAVVINLPISCEDRIDRAIRLAGQLFETGNDNEALDKIFQLGLAAVEAESACIQATHGA